MAKFNQQRGIKAVAIGMAVFSLFLWLGSGKNSIGIYFSTWQNLAVTAVACWVFAALVYWLFGRTGSPAQRR